MFRSAACSLSLALLGAFLALPSPARAQTTDWPNRPVTVVVPYAAGGFTDTLARIASKYISEKTGQSFVVENRAGAGGAIAAAYVTNAQPNGAIVLFGSASQVGIAPLIQKIGYNPDDLTPVSIFGKIPFLLAVSPTYPANDLKTFVADAKTRRPTLNMAIAGPGSTSHLLTTAFAAKAGIDVAIVTYKGSAPASASVMQGEVEAAWAGVSDVMTLVTGGKLKALSISGEQRIGTLPNVPAVGEDYPGFRLETWNGFFAPPGTPKAIVDKLAALTREAVAQPEIAKRLQEIGIEPRATTPDEMAAQIRAEKAFYVEAVKTANLKPE